VTADDIVAALTRMRVRHGLTQDDVAMAAGVTGAQISMIENHKRVPSMETLLRYAAAVGAEIAVARRRDEIPADVRPRSFRGLSRAIHESIGTRGVPS